MYERFFMIKIAQQLVLPVYLFLLSLISLEFLSFYVQYSFFMTESYQHLRSYLGALPHGVLTKIVDPNPGEGLWKIKFIALLNIYVAVGSHLLASLHSTIRINQLTYVSLY